MIAISSPFKKATKFACLLGLGCVGFVASLSADSDEALEKLFVDYWDYQMEHDPFSATTSGISDYNDRIPDASRQAEARHIERIKDFKGRLEAIDLIEANKGNRLSAELLDFILSQNIQFAKFDTWRIPFVSDSGFHTTFGYVLSATPFRNERDYENYLKRLKDLPVYLKQNIENMRTGIASGFTQPKAILHNTLPSFEALVTDSAEDHPYFVPFKTLPSSIDQSRRNELEVKGRQMIAEVINPAMVELVTFMRDEYIPQARGTLGAAQLPNGKEYYEAQVRFFTTLIQATPAQVHERGLREVERIRKEMDEVIAETGFTGSFEEFLEFLRTDPQFYPKTAEELLMKASWIAKQTDGRLPGFFGRLPKQPYSVEPVPQELEANYTAGRYAPAPPGSSRGGQYWVNTYALDTRSLYQLTALSLHEGVPGHHLQIALAYEIENTPEFRKQFYPHAFGEGWGLYSEKLGVEMGIYKTPYEHFGRLSYEMWRACRLVVDTGLHAFNWSREKAVEYLAVNTALSMHEVGTEIDRYIAWPGQALAYKMGELTIWDLRAEAEQSLGDKFDIRDFHDAVLEQGGVPLEILRAQIQAFIQEKR